jgi:WD40 repeat protein
MKLRLIFIFVALASTCLGGMVTALAQGVPEIVWEVPTPNGLANSIVGVGWSPDVGGRVAVGSTDRWMRTRQASTGALNYSTLQPQHTRGGDQTIFSTDGLFLAVHNRSGGLNYRVLRATDGVLLGTIVVTIDGNGLVQFAPDPQLQASVPGDGTMSRWRLEEFTVVFTVGSGYQTTTTTFNFSPNGAYQSTASIGSIKIQSRKDGSAIAVFSGGASRGFTPMSFTPDSTALAAWDADSDQTTLWNTDGAELMEFPDAVPEEGVSAIRFTPEGTCLVTSGYLAFQDGGGSWQQAGTIRFWRVADGMLRHQFDELTGIAVTSPIAWSPDASQFIYGTYEGTAVAAYAPPIAAGSLR